MKVVKLQHSGIICGSSPVRSVKGNVFDGGIDSDEEYNGDIR
jgi:hypothetical protein